MPDAALISSEANGESQGLVFCFVFLTFPRIPRDALQFAFQRQDSPAQRLDALELEVKHWKKSRLAASSSTGPSELYSTAARARNERT